MSEELDKIHFVMTPEEMKAIPEDDYEILERLQDGEPLRLYKFKPFAANFLVDENGQRVPKAQAIKWLGKVPVGEWEEIAKKFVEAMQVTAVPNGKGSLSNSPSEVSSAAPSPDGATT